MKQNVLTQLLLFSLCISCWPCAAEEQDVKRPRAGEIRLEGEIRAISRTKNTIAVVVASFALPNGRTSTLLAPKLKTVTLDNKATFFIGSPLKAIAFTDIWEWMKITVIGRDGGGGQTISARMVLVEEPSAPAPPFMDAMAYETVKETSPLMISASLNNVKDAQRLLDEGASVNEQDEKGITVLMKAAAMNSIATLKLLLDHGADANAFRADGNTALTYAAFHNNTEAVRVLTAHGADANAITRDGTLALMLPAGPNQAEVIKALLEGGADPNRRDRFKVSALEKAVILGNTEVIKVLLDNGADVTADTVNLAEVGRNDEAIELLQQHIAHTK